MRSVRIVFVLGVVLACGMGDRTGLVPVPAVGAAPEMAPPVLVDRADAAVVAELDRAKALLAARQWEEGIRSLRELMERSGGKLVPASPQRLIPLRVYGHMVLSGLPAEALALYRRQVDSLAQKWYQLGQSQHDKQLLQQVVDQAFASSWGDDALWLLGEMALEAGQYAEARWYWERLVPVQQALPTGKGTEKRPPAGPSAVARPISPLGESVAAEGQPSEGSPAEEPGTERTWLAYPDPQIDLAAVRARLVWTSILEGSFQRAREELAELARLHPEARGRLAGREVRFVEALQQMLDEAADWPRWKQPGDWLTFAKQPERSGLVGQVPSVGPVRWRAELPMLPTGPPASPSGPVQPTAAESTLAPLGYHPVVVGRWIFVNTLWEIYGWDLWTGQPLWHQGRIYRDPLDRSAQAALVPRQMWGRPRCTLSVHGHRLYARMGTPVSVWGQEGDGPANGYLVCLDLEAEGKLLWKLAPEDPRWAWEGSPVADGRSVYVAMRRSELGPHVQAYVASVDADTGRILWRTFVCGAEPPVRNLPQTSHHLLTLHGDTLYYNTNLGAVAAIRAADGQIQWIALYPRQIPVGGKPIGRHWARDLNPCLWDRGVLYVAPADHPAIFALDAATGQLLWQTGPELEDAVHLLGVWEDRLIATGDRIYGLATTGPRQGQVVFRWPDGPDRLGYGRGFLANGRIYWPTRHSVHVVDARTGQPIREILLRPLQTGGGNLLAANGLWIIAAEKELVCLGVGPTTPSEPQTTPNHPGGGKATPHPGLNLQPAPQTTPTPQNARE